LGFVSITDVITEVVEAHEPEEMSLEAVLDAERHAREHADRVIARMAQ
jgi:1-deoxy-D-xylulose-5-phosphate reductoisomerase